MNPGEVLAFTEDEIQALVNNLARRIAPWVRGRPTSAIVVMSGAAVFATDLLRKLPPMEVVHWSPGMPYPNQLFHGQQVLVVEDIIDSGSTVSKIMRDLLERWSRIQFRVVSLLAKSRDTVLLSQEEVLVGTIISNDLWVYGYGMDDPHGLGRNRPDIRAVQGVFPRSRDE